MILVSSRHIFSTTRNKLQSKLRLSSLVNSGNSMMVPSSTSSLSTETPPGPPPPTSPPSSSSLGDWPSDIFTGETKSRTIRNLSVDRDSTDFTCGGKVTRQAAVLVPFCYNNRGQPCILYNLRSANLNTHSGEISFPGGTLEEQDNGCPVAGALRETHEEVGISKDEVEVWTTCRVFPTVSTKMGVVPVVGFVKSGPVDPEKLEINPDEVDHAFLITLEHLCDPCNWGKMQPPTGIGGRSSFSFPIYQNLQEFSGGLDGTHLWGLTAFITHLVLQGFIPEKYTRRISYVTLYKEGDDKKDSDSSSSSASEKVKPTTTGSKL